ncbi:MAG: hypothetical protein U0354_17485 [Candidatus Sericytochromatia bacterium]
MINNKTKRGLLVALGLIITSCSTSINSIQEIKKLNSINSKNTNEVRVLDKNVKTFLTNEEFVEFKKEYSGFKTLALSYEYLYRKIQKLLTYNDNGLYLTKEIEFARVIHPSLLLQIYCDHPELYSDSDIKPKVIERKTNDSIFNDYLVQLSCGSSSGNSGIGEFQINSFTTNNQEIPDIAINSSGNFVVVWQSSGGQDGDDYGIFAQRYNSDGTPNGSEFQVNTYNTAMQYQPKVGIDDSGNFVVTWSSYTGNSSSSDIFAQRYNSDGTPNGSEFQVNSYTTYHQEEPDISMNSSGNFTIVWRSGDYNQEQQDGDRAGIFAQRYNSDGTPNGSEFQVNSYTIGSQGYPSISMNNTGSFVVAWESDWQDGDHTGIFAQKFNSDGTPNGSEFQANTYTTSQQNKACVAIDNTGKFVITWVSENQNNDYSLDIFAQKFNSDVTPNGSEFQVNSYITDSQFEQNVTIDNAGNFIITWVSDNQDGDRTGIFARRYNSNGISNGSEFQINSYTTGNQRNPSIAMNNTGNFVVTWQKQVEIPNPFFPRPQVNSEVMGKIYDANGVAQ